jgi:hypothetical protein
MKRYFILALVGFALGMITGYWAVWAEHYDTMAGIAAVTTNKWMDSLSFLGGLFTILDFPGIVGVVIQTHNRDFLIDEDWGYRYWEMLYNGIFWMLALPIFSFCIHLAKSLPRDLKSAYQNYLFRKKPQHAR